MRSVRIVCSHACGSRRGLRNATMVGWEECYRPSDTFDYSLSGYHQLVNW